MSTAARRGEEATVTAGRVECAAAVLAAAVATAVLAFRLGGGAPAADALAAALAVLLVGVPPALRLATRLPALIGTQRAARLGAVVSDAGVFEAARRIDTVVLAGTSTLTSGDLIVHAVHAVDGVPPAEVLRLAGAVAQESGRPADRAIAAASPRLPDVAEFDAVDGLGVRGLVAEVVGGPGEEQRVIAHAVLVGDAELLAVHDIAPPTVPPAAGRTPIAVAWDGVARGVLEVGPAVAPATLAAVGRLAAFGLRPVLLAAEDAPAAQDVAASAGLPPDAVLPGVTPQDAGSHVRDLGPGVALIAESRRYEEALGAAALAVGLPPHPRSPHPPALMLVHADLAAAVDALGVARHTAAVTRANVAFSLVCVAVLLPLTAAGLLGLALSATATATGAAALAINALRPQRPGTTGG